MTKTLTAILFVLITSASSTQQANRNKINVGVEQDLLPYVAEWKYRLQF